MAKRNTVKNIKNKYRIVIFNDSKFKEVFSLRLSLLYCYVIIGITACFFIILGMLIRGSMPITTNDINRQLYLQIIAKADSLEHNLNLQSKQYERILFALTGKDSLFNSDNNKIKPYKRTYKNKKPLLNLPKSKQDSILRSFIESEEKFNINIGKKPKLENQQIKNLHIYPPITKGIITYKYNAQQKHFGIDIAAVANTHIMAAMEGTVISAQWSVETGYSIVLQHNNNFITCYKHNSELLKKEGDTVKKGEAIAIIGNTGEYTTGPHLHFELWQNGKALNPEKHIIF